MALKKNKVKFGLNKVHYAKITSWTEDGVPTYWNGHCWCVDLKKYGWETSQADAAAFEKAFATPEDHLDLDL